MPEHDVVRNRLLAVLVGLASVAALKWSYPVSMPLAAAAFVVAAAWPVKTGLDRVVPAWASYAGTVLVLLVICIAFVAALYVSVSQLVGTLVERRGQFEAIYARATGWAAAHGLPVISGDDGYRRLLGVAKAVLADIWTIGAYVCLVAILVLFGLQEVSAATRRLRRSTLSEEADRIIATAEQISTKVRDYAGVTALTSVLTGAACAGWAAVTGLELAMLWGILNFLLNFFPVVGNIAGIVPPTLFAVVQFGLGAHAAIVFAGYATIQIVISNLVYPWLQGRGVSLSPTAILIALVFWGWAWGAAGGLMAIPLTAAFVVTCAQFRATGWIARLLSRE
ncbi:AI-2E family transporter [Falsiroseomonas sp. HW251]|uniref:AI-2E family transporter n=1 Tax=Falsiroseomonas sp. HW251 TaxID=3390998 RepID=UPI003D32073E